MIAAEGEGTSLVTKCPFPQGGLWNGMYELQPKDQITLNVQTANTLIINYKVYG